MNERERTIESVDAFFEEATARRLDRGELGQGRKRTGAGDASRSTPIPDRDE